MIKIVLLGAGNVAVHLAKAIEKSQNIDLIQRFARSEKNSDYFNHSIPLVSNLTNLKVADIYIMAVSDDAINVLSNQLKIKKGLLVHTSGNLPNDILEGHQSRGVFYPLQTFSKDQNLDFKSVPVCLETEKSEDYPLLETLANSLSNKIYTTNYQQRKQIHLAAVFANNFSNHMFKIANDICREQDIPFEILTPLIQETAHKILFLDPKNAQTGPAKRKDIRVIDNHLKQLDKNQGEIYKLVTNSIIDTYQ